MNKNIVELIKYAYEHVEFYKKLYDEAGIDVYGDLIIENLPIVKKEDIIKNCDIMISNEYKLEELVISHTSGTTGVQLFLYNSVQEQLRRAMIMWKERNYNCKDIIKEKKAMFYDIRELENPPIQLIDGMMFYNTTYLDDDRFLEYYQSMNDYQPKFINCSPSAFYEFMRFLKRTNRKLNYTIKYIEFMGEYVSDGMYKEFTEFFEGTTVINYYGSVEFYSIAHGCKNNKHHLVDDSVFVEIVEQDEERYGKVIVTSLINKAMPLIRYDLGDVARFSDIKCTCGKCGRVIELSSGRIFDYFLDGNRKITADLFRKVLTDYFVMKNDEDNFIQFSLQEIKKDVLQYNLLVHNMIDIDEITTFLTEAINEYTITSVKVIVRLELNMLEKTGVKFKMYDLMKRM